jgi:hypothetical protein
VLQRRSQQLERHGEDAEAEGQERHGTEREDNAAARKSERGWEEKRTVRPLSRRVESRSGTERRFQTLRLLSYNPDHVRYNADRVKDPDILGAGYHR